MTTHMKVLPVSLFLFFFCLVPSPEAQYTIDTASPINPGESGSGVFDDDHDSYVWKVVLEYDGSLWATVSQGEKSGQPYVIYDEAITGGTWIDSSYDALGAGVYYLVVKPFTFPQWEMDTYSISVHSEPNQSPNDTEPNDDIIDASPTGPGVKNDGHLGYYKPGLNDITDWWRMTLTGDGFMEVIAKTEMEGFTLSLPFVYTAEGRLINSLADETKTDGALAQTYALAEGTYVINCSATYGYGSYALDTSFSIAALDNDHEPNDVLHNADILELDIPASGHLGYVNDSYDGINGPTNITDMKDWWGVSLDSDGELIVSTHAEEGPEIDLYIYNGAGNLLIMGNRDEWTSTVSIPLGKGYYYILADRPLRGYGSYSIETTLTPFSLAKDSEPNDSIETASILEGSGTGTLGYYTHNTGETRWFDIEDYWKVTVDNDGQLDIKAETSDDFDFILNLYSDSGRWETMDYSDNGVSELKRTVQPGNYYLLVRGDNGFGSYTIIDQTAVDTAVDDIDSGTIPHQFALHPASPNPFNPTTAIRYELPRESHVSLVVYDINGRAVAVLENGTAGPGFHEAVWNGRDSDGNTLGGGVYLYRLTAGTFSAQGKMTLLK